MPTVIDMILYSISLGTYVYARSMPQSQTYIKQILFVLYGAVAISHVLVLSQHTFDVLLGLGIMGVAMILLVMYRADKMPMYYYQTMICVVMGIYLASQDNFISLLFGIVCIIAGLYHKVCWTNDDKNGIRSAYTRGIILAFICIICGIFLILADSDFYVAYDSIALRVYQNPSLLFYVGSVLLLVGVMGVMGMVPFSTALLNVHRIFEQPLVMVNRLLVVTTLCLILGNVIISIYAYAFDIFWRTIFMGIGFLSMVMSIIGSLVQNSIKRLYGYVVLGHIGFMATILSMGQLNTLDTLALAIQYTVGYVLSYMAFWSYARSVYVGRQSLENIGDLSMLQNCKPYYTFWFVVSALCFAGFPPLAVFWGKILVLAHPENSNQWFFNALVILIFIQGMWALRFIYFVYIYPVPSKTQVVYTHNASSLAGIMRVLLTIFAIFYVFI